MRTKHLFSGAQIVPDTLLNTLKNKFVCGINKIPSGRYFKEQGKKGYIIYPRSHS